MKSGNLLIKQNIRRRCGDHIFQSENHPNRALRHLHFALQFFFNIPRYFNHILTLIFPVISLGKSESRKSDKLLISIALCIIVSTRGVVISVNFFSVFLSGTIISISLKLALFISKKVLPFALLSISRILFFTQNNI